MQPTLRLGVVALTVIVLLVGATGAVVADGHGTDASQPCDALSHASDQANSNAAAGLGTAMDGNDCRSDGPIPIPEE